MNRSLPPGDRGHRGATSGRPPGRGRAVSGTGGLVGGIEAARRGGDSKTPFKVIKHGGFARFWRETPCAFAGFRTGCEGRCS
jgi:hypothetical protein